MARMSSATTGTGTITLGSAIAGKLTFAQAGVQNGDIVSYGVIDGLNFEIGWGVYTSSGTTLSRNVIRSSNSNTAIALTGAQQVFICALAEDIQHAYVDPTDMQFGALGDDDANDTAAIQAAVDAAPAGSTIRFRKGYHFRHQRVTIGKSLVLEFDAGCWNELLEDAGSGQCLFDVTTEDGVYFDIKGGRLGGDRANQSGGHHNHCAIRSDGYGVVVVNGHGHLGRIDGFDGYGIWLRSADNFWTDGVKVTNTYLDGIYYEAYDADVANWWVQNSFVDRRGEADFFEAGCIKMQSANQTRWAKHNLYLLNNVALMDDDQNNVPVEVWNGNWGRILSFNSGGTYEVEIDDLIVGATSGATARVTRIDVFSGSWAGGNATGEITIVPVSGTFSSTENLNVGANNNVATLTAVASTDPPNKNVFIIGNRVEGSKIGISVTCGYNVEVAHNSVSSNNWIGIEFAACAGVVRCFGNHVELNPGSLNATGIVADNQQHDAEFFIFQANTIKNAIFNISLKGGLRTMPRKITVQGNIVQSAETGAFGVGGDGTINVACQGNVIDLTGASSRAIVFGDGSVAQTGVYRSENIEVVGNTCTAVADVIVLGEVSAAAVLSNTCRSTSGAASIIAAFDPIDLECHGNIALGSFVHFHYFKAQGRNCTGIRYSGDGGVECQSANGFTLSAMAIGPNGDKWQPDWGGGAWVRSEFMHDLVDAGGARTLRWRDGWRLSDSSPEGVVPGLAASMLRQTAAATGLGRLWWKANQVVSDEGWLDIVRETDAGALHGEKVTWKTATQELTTLSGATVTATGLIPDGAVDPIVTTRVTAEPGGSVTHYTVGDGTDPDLWGATAAKTVGTTTGPVDYTAQPNRVQIGAGNVVLTAVGASFNGTGAIRVTVQYREYTAPTS